MKPIVGIVTAINRTPMYERKYSGLFGYAYIGNKIKNFVQLVTVNDENVINQDWLQKV